MTGPHLAYQMSFSTGGLFVNESVEVARLHTAGDTWIATRQKALASAATTLPKAASNQRTLREIANRVSQLSEEERFFLVQEADRTDQEGLLWVACCRAYRFVREVAVEVIQERYLSYRLDLPLETFDQFFGGKAEWDDGLANLSTSTRAKLRQVLFRIMREAGILDTADCICPALLSPRLTQLIASGQPDELLCFPGQRPELHLA